MNAGAAMRQPATPESSSENGDKDDSGCNYATCNDPAPAEPFAKQEYPEHGREEDAYFAQWNDIADGRNAHRGQDDQVRALYEQSAHQH